MSSVRNAVLQCPMEANDSGAGTVGAYLTALLRTLWQEGEGFSGKRPFGNSSWEFDIYAALIANGLVKGELDEDGYIVDFDEPEANKLIFAAIDGLMEPPMNLTRNYRVPFFGRTYRYRYGYQWRWAFLAEIAWRIEHMPWSGDGQMFNSVARVAYAMRKVFERAGALTSTGTGGGA